MHIVFTGVERVTHDEDRIREARYWAERTIAERVIAGWNLRDNNLIQRDESLKQRNEHEPEERTGITLRRVARSRR